MLMKNYVYIQTLFVVLLKYSENKPIEVKTVSKNKPKTKQVKR